MLRVTSHGDCGTTSSDSSTYFHRQAYVTNQLTPNPKQGLADSYTLTYSFILSVRHLIARTRTPSIAHSYTPSLTLYFSHKLAHSLTLSLTHTHAHTPSFPPSLTHSLTHSLSIRQRAWQRGCAGLSRVDTARSGGDASRQDQLCVL